ncbi:hypothetical protein [Streptomyces sp. Da 82-17]|uniref:hypothetical protein n=1 Tax=Streptomyces sp. Da 82-17 TaxID=3377116 RepID=UPI0038D35A29
MDATAWVGIVGIAGTLLGTLLAPIAAERMRRKSVRAEQLVVIYADLLRATARFADNARDSSTHPLAELKETEDEELDRLMSQVRVVASDSVHERINRLSSTIHEFNRLLVLEARPHHQRLREDGQAVDDEKSIQQRMSLSDIADRVVQAHKELESVIRAEMKP